MPRRTFIALLRGINVGGKSTIRMAELRPACEGLGWQDVRSYIQSGNLVFRAETEPARLETALEEVILREFGLAVPVIVRNGRDWPAYLEGNPFPDASRAAPNLVMLGLSKQPPNSAAVNSLRQRATNGELLALVGDALWIHFAQGAGRSKVSPGLLDRAVGSPVTTRNWRTVVTLNEMLRELGPG